MKEKWGRDELEVSGLLELRGSSGSAESHVLRPGGGGEEEQRRGEADTRPDRAGAVGGVS